MLGHLTNNNHIFGKSDNQKTDNQHEIEAEAFALSFLSPIPILCEMKAYSPREICHLTELPDDLAQEVSRNISFRDPYKKTLLEEKIIEAFRDTIIEHMNIKREMFSRIAMEDLHSPKENNLKSILKSKNTFILTVFLSCILSISIWSLEQSFQNKTLSEKQASPPPTQTQNVSHSILVPEKVEKEIPSVETVFVTSTGAKYHLQDCQYIKTKTNVSKISTTDALKIGLLPCKVCHPDEKK